MRLGKDIYLGSIVVQPERFIKPVRMVYQVTERTLERDGQALLIPDIELSLYWTSLECPEEQVVNLYKDQIVYNYLHFASKKRPSFAQDGLSSKLAVTDSAVNRTTNNGDSYGCLRRVKVWLIFINRIQIRLYIMTNKCFPNDEVIGIAPIDLVAPKHLV